jgi:hypothetical protein
MKKLFAFLILTVTLTSCQSNSGDSFIPSYAKEFKMLETESVSNRLVTDPLFAENLTKELNQILSE